MYFWVVKMAFYLWKIRCLILCAALQINSGFIIISWFFCQNCEFQFLFSSSLHFLGDFMSQIISIERSTQREGGHVIQLEVRSTQRILLWPLWTCALTFQTCLVACLSIFVSSLREGASSRSNSDSSRFGIAVFYALDSSRPPSWVSWFVRNAKRDKWLFTLWSIIHSSLKFLVATMGEDISPFQTLAVQENALKSLPCPTMSVLELEDEEHDGPSSLAPDILTLDQIPSAFSAAKDDNVVKATVRSQCMHFKSPLRSLMWKTLYLRMEALASSTTDPLNAASLAEATAGLFRDTLLTCFGTLDFPSSADDVSLPSCIDPDHVNSYFLNTHGKISVSRVLTCFAYNQPDLQYCPMLYPIASTLRHFLTGKDLLRFPIFPLLYEFLDCRRRHVRILVHYGFFQAFQVPFFEQTSARSGVNDSFRIIQEVLGRPGSLFSSSLIAIE